MKEEDFQEIIRVQQMMSQRILQEHQLDNKIEILNIVNDLTQNGKKRTQVEAIILEAGMNNVNEGEVRAILDDLERDHLIKRSKTGFVERT